MAYVSRIPQMDGLPIAGDHASAVARAGNARNRSTISAARGLRAALLQVPYDYLIDVGNRHVGSAREESHARDQQPLCAAEWKRTGQNVIGMCEARFSHFQISGILESWNEDTEALPGETAGSLGAAPSPQHKLGLYSIIRGQAQVSQNSGIGYAFKSRRIGYEIAKQKTP